MTTAGTAAADSPSAVAESNVASSVATTCSAPLSDPCVAQNDSALERFRAALRSGEQEHWQRLQELQESRASSRPRRGQAWQQRRRDLQCRIRRAAVHFYCQVRSRGGSLVEAAEALGVTPRTLRDWAGKLRLGRLTAVPLGRPRTCADAAQRNRVIDFLHDQGPGVGIPTLQEQFPELARADLVEMQQRFRRLLRCWTRRRQYVLRWPHVGAVWSMDFAEPSLPGVAWSLPPIDGRYPYLLAVRDLASGYQLCWLAVSAATADVTIAVLRRLFACNGAPLVLKCDNGPPFRADETKTFLAAAGVVALFSPPHCPRYNGSIEAAVGSLKSRTLEQAAWQGRPTCWTSAAAEAARLQANTSAALVRGPTAAETWAQRSAISPTERRRFQLTVERRRDEVYTERAIDLSEQPDHWKDSAIDRKAIQRALVEHGYLLFRRRRIPLEISEEKVANIW